MTNPVVWVPLTIAFATGTCTWATLVIRLMWQFRGKWDYSNAQLARVAERITELAAQDSRIEERLQTHLDWHMTTGRTGPGRRG